jgi:pantoate--beta-alanine ligase
MRTIVAIAEMQRFADAERAAGRRIGFVPTMGALHEGHLSLVRRARGLADTVVVSIFVNPIQFDSRTDFERYPRDEATDAKLLETEGVEVLFLPRAEEMYPPGFQTRVEVTELSKPLCGAHRPGHFAGVATVVTKLFAAVKPHVAVFGEKDYQQLQLVRRMVRDLNFDLEIVAGPTVREPDGLAMSSRNRRLSAPEREKAARIPAAIARVRELAARGTRSARSLERAFREPLEGLEGVRVEYAELRDASTLEALGDLDRTAVFAVAVWVGDVRLIDNVVLEPGGASTSPQPGGAS